MALEVGTVAPDFEIEAVLGSKRTKVRLRELVERSHVVLSFYPLNWTPVCSNQTASFNALLPRFRELGAEVIGISTDQPYSHIAWQEKSVGEIGYPLCSDFYPHGEVSRAYGVLRTGDPVPGISERAVFVLEQGSGIVRFARVYHLGEQPDGEEVLAALQKMPVPKQAATSL
jgi:alkyl hydroperoxide reductase subunit AhpC